MPPPRKAHAQWRSLLIIDALVVIYALAYQLQTPLEPYLVDKLVKGESSTKDTSLAYAQLQSFFGVIQLVGSLLVGSLIDVFGVKAMLLVNFVSCALTYALLALAAQSDSLPLLYASKLPTVFMAGFLCAQTAVSALTAPGAERITELGKLTMAYTAGATIGPTLGGFLGTAFAAPLAVVASLAAGTLAYLALPSGLDTVLGQQQQARKSGSSPSSSSSFSSWLSTALSVLALAAPFVATKAAGGLVNTANASVRTVAMKDVFMLSPPELGVIMSTISFGTAVASLGLGRITKSVGSETSLVRLCLGGAAVTFAAQAALFTLYYSAPPPAGAAGAAAASSPPTPPTWLLKATYVGLTLLLALFTFPLSTTLTALSTSRVPASTRGTLIGIEHSVFAVASVAGPPLGVMAKGSLGMGGVAAVAGGAYGLILACWSGGLGTSTNSSRGSLGKGKKKEEEVEVTAAPSVPAVILPLEGKNKQGKVGVSPRSRRSVSRGPTTTTTTKTNSKKRK